ncbi:MAG: UDP-N-acetylmuramoyl-L-alanyl-D-glutamate--2,6-diaminopimelate ligase, partial [Bacillota bacterium]
MDKTLHSVTDYFNLLDKHHLVSDYVTADNQNKVIQYISYNSMDIEEDTLFVCKGSHFSVKYLASAIEKGTICYISETKYEIETDKKVSFIIVNDIRKTMALIADYYYNQIWKDLNIVGITGTKGK